MRVLVTGVKGQLGYDVMNELKKQGLTGIGVDVDEMDITDAEACRRVITEAKPDAVIHCAAYTAVDAAEQNMELCRKVNADGTRNIAEVGKGLDIKMPVNYYPNDDDTQKPRLQWRSHGNILYSNWLNYYVYQTTPFQFINTDEIVGK